MADGSKWTPKDRRQKRSDFIRKNMKEKGAKIEAQNRGNLDMPTPNREIAGSITNKIHYIIYSVFDVKICGVNEIWYILFMLPG